jgi:hypothetical protein
MRKSFDELATPLVVNDRDWGNPIEDDVKINQSDLDQEFLNQPEKYAWWAFLMEHAKAQVNEVKNELEILYAKLDYQVRAKAQVVAVDAKAKKTVGLRYTEKMVENEVISSKEYQEIMSRYNEARKNAGLATAGMNAMLQRRDMLLQLGANYRTEGQADPIILREAAREKAANYAKDKEARKAERDERLNKVKDAQSKSNMGAVREPPRRPPTKPAKE